MSNTAAVLGRIGVQLESLSNPGEVLIFSGTVASIGAGANPTIQPDAVSGSSAYTGSRLLIVVSGNSATGSVSLAGKDFSQAQNAITETTPTIPIAGSPSNPLNSGYEYVTANIFSVFSNNGITVSGLTGGTVKIYAIEGARSLQPAMFDAEEKIAMYSPQEQRGLVSRNSNIQRLNKVVDISKLEQDFYPDTCAWWFGRCVVGSNPTQVTLPGTPTVLLNTTTVSSLPTSATAQPNSVALAEIIQVIVTGSSAVGTVTITGNNWFGQAIIETIQCGVPGAANGNGTFYSIQAFATINGSGISASGLTGGSVKISGYYLLQETYTASSAGAGDTLQSVSLEWYTGADAVVLPYTYFTEVTLEGSAEKEMKLTAKGGAQDMLTIGNRSTTPQAASTYATQIGAPGSFSSTGSGAGGVWEPYDFGVSGWQVQWYIDALSGTPGTTAYNSVVDWKVTFKTPQKPSYTSINWNRLQKVYRQQRETEIQLTVDFIDVIQYEQFRQNIKQLLQLYIQGPPVGAGGAYKNWTFNFAARLTEAKRDASKMDRVEATFKFTCEYTLNAFGAGVHGEYQLITQTQMPANYAA